MSRRPPDMPDHLNWLGEPRQRAKRNPPEDLKELERIAQFHHTLPELARYFQCSEAVLSREPYHSAIVAGRNYTNGRLKQKAIQRALDDNSDTMLIFCLKNYCGWANDPDNRANVAEYDEDSKQVDVQINLITKPDEPKPDTD